MRIFFLIPFLFCLDDRLQIFSIIDDPLEAFNRIMREKERAKEEQARRRSPLFVNKYRRSRTPDRRRKRRSNSFEGSPIKRHFDRRVIDRKRRRSRSFSSSR